MRFASLAPVLASSILALLLACGDDDGDGDGDDGGSDAGGADGGSQVDAGPGADAGPGDDGGSQAILCGGLAGLTCEETHYCDYPDETCGDGDIMGQCLRRPTFCEASLRGRGVCGCDGMFYESACAAAMVGVDLAKLKRCSGVAPP